MWRVMRDKLWATSMKNGEMKVASTAFTFTWYPTLQKKYHKQRKTSNTSAWMMQKSTETLSKITPKMRKYTAHSERTWSVSLIQIFSSSSPIFLWTISLKKISPLPLRFFSFLVFSSWFSSSWLSFPPNCYQLSDLDQRRVSLNSLLLPSPSKAPTTVMAMVTSSPTCPMLLVHLRSRPPP